MEDQSLRQDRENPPLTCERKQLELGLPVDPLREFVVSVDTADIRSADPKTARDFKIVVARRGRGGRGMAPGHYFVTSDTSQLEVRARTLQALQFEGYCRHGEVTVLCDGAEIMKRLPKALPKPTTHIIDWFHLAMKIRPMQQIAGHIVGSQPILCGILAVIDEEIRALKWKLWHGQAERAICALEKIIVDIMVKNQQMRWSSSGAHLMLQVRVAMVNDNLRQRLRQKPDLPALPSTRSFNQPRPCSESHEPQTFCRSLPIGAAWNAFGNRLD